MERTIIEGGFYILRYTNEGDQIQQYEEAVSQEFIQFHFCQKGAGSFEFNGGSYQLPLMSKNVILLYNPQKALPIDLKLTPGSAVVSLVISIKKFHSLFSEDADHIHFLSPEKQHQKILRYPTCKSSYERGIKSNYGNQSPRKYAGTILQGKSIRIVEFVFQ